MDREADESVVGGENISGDQIGSNSGGIATTTRQASSISVRKKRYKKLDIAKSILYYLIYSWDWIDIQNSKDEIQLMSN